MNNYKQKILQKQKQIGMILKYGNEIEKESNGQKPDWKTIYKSQILERNNEK